MNQRIRKDRFAKAFSARDSAQIVDMLDKDIFIVARLEAIQFGVGVKKSAKKYAASFVDDKTARKYRRALNGLLTADRIRR